MGIKTDDPDQQQKIKRDFIDALRSLLYKSKYKYSFEFIEIPDRFLDGLENPDYARKLLYELDCKFMIYGRARNTVVKGNSQHILNLEGVVTHKPIASEVSKSFSKEFSELFPRRLIISKEGDLFQFEISANWIDVVSKYIIGIAALLSGDIDYSQELFESLQIILQGNKANLPAITKIRERLSIRLRDIYIIRLRLAYEDWRRTKDVGDIDKMKPLLDILDTLAPGNLETTVFRSMWYFVVERDIASAKNECVKGRTKQNITWRYNYAFLFAYEGHLERAEKEYRKAFSGYYSEPGFILDIIDFILWILDIEPDKVQFHYCLGLIYYKVINDFSLALQCFEKFLEHISADQYLEQKNETEKLISEIQKKHKVT